MTFAEVEDRALANSMNLAQSTVMSMMDIIQEQTGRWPEWNEQAPKWVLDNFGIKEANDDH
ncbi:MAG: hypothetical protein IJH11_00295 [Lachnospiraceae bacterium]|nr:hypothetical protein [Lachnospiraceae bacterium]